jgi:DNA-binding LacI/PurR family transcriptional regulator
VCTVPLTTVPQYNKQMGEAALQILMERVGNGVYGGRILREYRPDTVIVRNSV